MYRRRRRTRDIPFGLDSFLDVIANVVGVIIRLILVAWVGARSYDMISKLARSEAPPLIVEETVESEQPLLQKLATARQELEQARSRLEALVPDVHQYDEKSAKLKQQLVELTTKRLALEKRQAAAGQERGKKQALLQDVELALADLRKRRQALDVELRAIEQAPPAKRELRYRTPVSRPVHAEELHFECRAGRVTFVDIGAFVDEIRRGLQEKERLLRTRWQVEEVTGPVGAFRLRYTLERERGALEGLTSGAEPNPDGPFRYGLSRWVVEPIAAERGESPETALAARSAFRQAIAGMNGRSTVVTFWVHPDSFALFRQLRDYLYDHGFEVAGRPLPDGIPIASSRQGTASRGQ